MLQVIMTSDYEIHGNGDGAPRLLMVEPTERMLELFRPYDAKLTIMADVAEILRFREFRDGSGSDACDFDAIVAQLRNAVALGHDVQLHLHPSYCRAIRRAGRWIQDYGSYDISRLGRARIVELVRTGKQFLEGLLQTVDPSYQCHVFRAANWSMQPSVDIVQALIENGIRIDTSVFKYGRRDGLVCFDYADAWSDLIPWPIDPRDVCARDVAGALFEVPIYSELRWVGAFVSLLRLYRLWVARLHRHVSRSDDLARAGRSSSLWSGLGTLTRLLFTRHAWKLDFNQCSSGQLIAGLRRAEIKTQRAECDLPVVLIGHSKLFTERNARSLKRFLRYVAERPARYVFGSFRDVRLESIVRAFHTAAS